MKSREQFNREANAYATTTAAELRHQLDELTARMVATAAIETFIKDQEQLYARVILQAVTTGAQLALEDGGIV